MLLNYKKAIASSLLTLCSLCLCGSLKKAIACKISTVRSLFSSYASLR
ncbi:hypothetical protein [Nostoc sp.]